MSQGNFCNPCCNPRTLVMSHKRGSAKCVSCGRVHRISQHWSHAIAGRAHPSWHGHAYAAGKRYKRTRKNPTSPVCSFCSNVARYRVYRYKLCTSCLKKACHLKGVRFPTKTRANPTKEYLTVAKGYDGSWYIVGRRGRTILKIVAGPFSTEDAAIERLLYRKQKTNPGKKEHYLSYPAGKGLVRIVQARSKQQAEKQCPWASVIIRGKEGFWCFEDPKDWLAYSKQKINPRRNPTSAYKTIPRGNYWTLQQFATVAGHPWLALTHHRGSGGGIIVRYTGYRHEMEDLATRLGVIPRILPKISEKEFFRNPPDKVKLGRAMEVRYERTVGRHRGNYKHEFESSPDLYYRNSTGEVCMR